MKGNRFTQVWECAKCFANTRIDQRITESGKVLTCDYAIDVQLSESKVTDEALDVHSTDTRNPYGGKRPLSSQREQMLHQGIATSDGPRHSNNVRQVLKNQISRIVDLR